MLVCLKPFFFFFFFFASFANTDAFSHKDSVPNLIRADGYTVEVHHVTTDDGYILELHRIPYGRNESSGGRFQKPVVFMAHCLMCSSSAYVVLGPNGGLAYMLANQGFDVWMLNSRGNDYSQKHLTLSNKSRKFWQFSWHEQGTYDMPAGIDYVLNKTGEKQLDAIGYSMGTTQLFVMLSERPEYNNKLKSFTALAPAVFLGSSSATMVQLAFSIQDIVIKVRAETGRLEMAGRSSGLKDLFQALCQPQSFIFRKFCIKALILAGGTSANINLKTLPFYFKYFPEPTSLRTLVHFLQIIKAGDFRKYSYGTKLNKLNYNSRSPPRYDLSKVTAPINLMWSAGDQLTPSKDAKKLLEILPNVVSIYEIPKEMSFSHVDFIWARNAHTTVNNVVIQRLKGLN